MAGLVQDILEHPWLSDATPPEYEHFGGVRDSPSIARQT
jgi:hypothetical protein